MARVTHRAGALCSPAVPPPRPTSGPARRACSDNWPAAPTAARSATRTAAAARVLRRRRGRRAGFDGGIQAALERMLVSSKFLFRDRARSGAASRRAPPTGSAISSSRRGCRSSCGAASPTMSCWTLPIAASSGDPAVLERAGAADARRSAVAGAGRQLRRPVAGAAQRRDVRARRRPVPGVRREPARARSSGRPSCSSKHSCARIAASSSCSPPTTRSSTSGSPSTTASRTSTASQFRRVTFTDGTPRRAARAGQHPDGDVVPEPHLAGAARQVGAREPARHAAAAAAARRAGARGQGRRRAGAVGARAAGAAPRRTRRARAATRAWIRWASRWRTSTRIGRWRDVDGYGAPIDASGSLPDGTPFDGAGRAAAGSARAPRRRSSTTVTEKLLTYALGRGVEAVRQPAVRAIVRDAAPATTAGRRSSSASSRARRSR